MIKRFYRNKQLLKKYSGLTNNSGEKTDGGLYSIFKAKNGYLFLIKENNVSDENGNYHVLGHRKNVGYLNWHVCFSPEQTYLLLCDISLDPQYRNIGIGSYLIKQLEHKAIKNKCEYITGDLSIVDEETERDKNLRDNFYIKNGYNISGRKIIEYL